MRLKSSGQRRCRRRTSQSPRRTLRRPPVPSRAGSQRSTSRTAPRRGGAEEAGTITQAEHTAEARKPSRAPPRRDGHSPGRGRARARRYPRPGRGGERPRRCCRCPGPGRGPRSASPPRSRGRSARRRGAALACSRGHGRRGGSRCRQDGSVAGRGTRWASARRSRARRKRNIAEHGRDSANAC